MTTRANGAAPGPGSATGAVREPVRTVDAAGCFDHSCVETLTIDCPVDRVYEALFRVAEWPVHLPHVQQIDVIYDDGQYQEFWITEALETDGSPLRVRSVRNCRFRQIEFFQPQPQPFLRHHAGIWRFAPHGDDACALEVTHVWNLEPRIAATVYPPESGRSTSEQVKEMLAGHSRLAS